MQPVLRQRHRRSLEQGFTLLELMVVVAIIGIIVVGALLSLGATGKDSALEQERDRLVDLMAYGRERGAMLTLEYGIRCGQHGYRFVFFDNRLNLWRPESVDDTMRPRHLPAGLQLALTIEGHDIVLNDKALQINPGSKVPAVGSLSNLTSALTGAANGNGVPSASTLNSAAGATAATGANTTGGGGGAGGSSSSSLNSTVNDDAPQILLFSNGDTNSFVLTISRPDVGRSVTLQSSDDGTIHVGDIVEGKP